MHPLCCLWECIVCPTFLHTNLACRSSHSAQAHSVWQIHVCSSQFCECPCQLFFSGASVRPSRMRPSRSKLTARESACRERIRVMHVFLKSWINEFAVGFIIRACLCQVFYNSGNRLRPAVPGAWKLVSHANSSCAKCKLDCKLARADIFRNS